MTSAFVSPCARLHVRALLVVGAAVSVVPVASAAPPAAVAGGAAAVNAAAPALVAAPALPHTIAFIGINSSGKSTLFRQLPLYSDCDVPAPKWRPNTNQRFPLGNDYLPTSFGREHHTGVAAALAPAPHAVIDQPEPVPDPEPAPPRSRWSIFEKKVEQPRFPYVYPPLPPPADSETINYLWTQNIHYGTANGVNKLSSQTLHYSGIHSLSNANAAFLLRGVSGYRLSLAPREDDTETDDAMYDETDPANADSDSDFDSDDETAVRKPGSSLSARRAAVLQKRMTEVRIGEERRRREQTEKREALRLAKLKTKDVKVVAALSAKFDLEIQEMYHPPMPKRPPAGQLIAAVRAVCRDALAGWPLELIELVLELLSIETHRFGHLIYHVWNDPGVREAWRHRHDFDARADSMCNIAYYLNAILRIASIGYTPTLADILRSPSPTRFDPDWFPRVTMSYRGRRWVAGDTVAPSHHSYPRAWVAASAPAVPIVRYPHSAPVPGGLGPVGCWVFVLPVNEYVKPESCRRGSRHYEQTNQCGIEQSLDQFNQLTSYNNSKTKAPIIVVFTKRDVLIEKLCAPNPFPITQLFPEFDPSSTKTAAATAAAAAAARDSKSPATTTAASGSGLRSAMGYLPSPPTNLNQPQVAMADAFIAYLTSRMLARATETRNRAEFVAIDPFQPSEVERFVELIHSQLK